MKVAVIADWDADGTVSAAQIVYSQESLGLFPVRSKIPVDLLPSGPRGVREKVEERCWDVILIMDIPFIQEVDAALSSIFARCAPTLYYFDHHDVTIRNKRVLEEKYSASVTVGNSSTAFLVKSFLEKLGMRPTPRLRQFIEAVDHIEGGNRRRNGANERIIRLTVSISKYLNITKSQEMWQRYVRWLASLLPFDELDIIFGKEVPELINESLKTSQEADEGLKSIAMSFAMSAKKVGYVRLVDARDKWSGRGASALASAIHKMLAEPLVLLVSREDGVSLLIARSSRGEAEAIVRYLYEAGIVEDKGGHQNIAIARLTKGIPIEEIEVALIKASLLMRGR